APLWAVEGSAVRVGGRRRLLPGEPLQGPGTGSPPSEVLPWVAWDLPCPVHAVPGIEISGAAISRRTLARMKWRHVHINADGPLTVLEVDGVGVVRLDKRSEEHTSELQSREKLV